MLDVRVTFEKLLICCKQTMPCCHSTNSVKGLKRPTIKFTIVSILLSFFWFNQPTFPQLLQDRLALHSWFYETVAAELFCCQTNGIGYEQMERKSLGTPLSHPVAQRSSASFTAINGFWSACNIFQYCRNSATITAQNMHKVHSVSKKLYSNIK